MFEGNYQSNLSLDVGLINVHILTNLFISHDTFHCESSLFTYSNQIWFPWDAHRWSCERELRGAAPGIVRYEKWSDSLYLSWSLVTLTDKRDHWEMRYEMSMKEKLTTNLSFRSIMIPSIPRWPMAKIKEQVSMRFMREALSVELMILKIHAVLAVISLWPCLKWSTVTEEWAKHAGILRAKGDTVASVMVIDGTAIGWELSTTRRRSWYGYIP